ncbi:unnamed protein product [Cylicostephanus goldi]|uniref:DNA-directed RNA polymerase III subunit RPC9 n=1 Tax=Cylicostephanus goldi TaxID=71465 RepID=A0A3P7R3H8_CYLGO|nr:unnamed protein product [Cylicostephanus goldi]
MEVLNKQLTLLTNYEVLRLVNESKKQEDKKAKNDRSKHLSTILYEVTSKYLKTTPAQEQNPEVIEKLIKAVAPYKLTAAETMQLINLRPTTAAEVQSSAILNRRIFQLEQRVRTATSAR